ncbi:hypothetical protein DDV21_002115 [Streptococcus chenjunshii]|uniref:DUF2127 domain-containing protein n=1 Tax=Streptococcus chenjunshii TaxID=2173853 RepID=A0A372KNN4_9STRE|nr:hypothetical protein [Streptococcus chenjunshii]AXQ77949.1 hypothetical protein DDV21_002115 [Streptococcus chenjunshii]RFU51807.1 hypothetical protein DDV22_01655 [Streptococcus chenjunshii]RFU53895.1 hypothetical protein DDV23_02155 [Streptococcus chenjunshii]
MISYEKVRQTLRTLNITVLVLEFISVLLGILSFIGIFTLRANLENEEVTSAYTAEQLEALRASITPFAIFISVVTFVISVAIIVLVFRNLSKQKDGEEISYIPYFLGMGVTVFNIIYSFTSGFNIWGLLIQGIFLALYVYAFVEARTLNEGNTTGDAS